MNVIKIKIFFQSKIMSIQVDMKVVVKYNRLQRVYRLNHGITVRQQDNQLFQKRLIIE